MRRVLVATDFGPSSEHALELGCDMASRYGAELIVVHCVELPAPLYPIALLPEPAKVQALAQRALLDVVDRVRARVAAARGVLLTGNPAREIPEFAEQNGVDLIVVGTHGRTGPSRWLLGSVAEKIVRSFHGAILTVHEDPQRANVPSAASAP